MKGKEDSIALTVTAPFELNNFQAKMLDRRIISLVSFLSYLNGSIVMKNLYRETNILWSIVEKRTAFHMDRISKYESSSKNSAL